MHLRFCLRVAVSIAAALVVLLWLGVRSARADAPQCDSRGAITYAPNPVLDVPNASLDAPRDDCDDSDSELRVFAFHEGRAPASASATDALVRAASLPQVHCILPATPTATIDRDDATDGKATGVRRSIDRPPRA